MEKSKKSRPAKYLKNVKMTCGHYSFRLLDRKTNYKINIAALITLSCLELALMFTLFVVMYVR